MVVLARFGEDDLRLGLGRQVIQCDDEVPAVHLALVDLLRAVIEAAGIAEPDGIGGGEQAEIGIGTNDPVLVEQGQLALDLEDALDDEHHVGTTRIIFVEDQGGGMLQRPGEQAFAKLGDLLALAHHDRVAPDKVDAADVRIEVDADARPVETCGDLFDVRRLAGAVIARDHDATIIGKARRDRQRGVGIEDIGGVEIGDSLVGLAERGHFHVAVDAE